MGQEGPVWPVSVVVGFGRPVMEVVRFVDPAPAATNCPAVEQPAATLTRGPLLEAAAVATRTVLGQAHQREEVKRTNGPARWASQGGVENVRQERDERRLLDPVEGLVEG